MRKGGGLMSSEPSPQMLLFNPERRKPRAASYQAVKDIEPLSRSMDPVGSFQAAERTHKTGIGGRKRLAMYHALRQHPGSTSAELGRAMDVDRHDVARRLPELERAGWVVRGRRRRCKVCAVECVTWYCSRRWIDGPRPAVPCERPCPATTSEPAAPSAPAEGSAGHGRPGDLSAVPSNVTTPEDRRRLRERLAADGDERTRAFLRGLR